MVEYVSTSGVEIESISIPRNNISNKRKLVTDNFLLANHYLKIIKNQKLASYMHQQCVIMTYGY